MKRFIKPQTGTVNVPGFEWDVDYIYYPGETFHVTDHTITPPMPADVDIVEIRDDDGFDVPLTRIPPIDKAILMNAAMRHAEAAIKLSEQENALP